VNISTGLANSLKALLEEKLPISLHQGFVPCEERTKLNCKAMEKKAQQIRDYLTEYREGAPTNACPVCFLEWIEGRDINPATGMVAD